MPRRDGNGLATDTLFYGDSADNAKCADSAECAECIDSAECADSAKMHRQRQQRRTLTAPTVPTSTAPTVPDDNGADSIRQVTA